MTLGAGTNIATLLGYNGVSGSGLNGTWYLEVTDVRNDRLVDPTTGLVYRAPEFMNHWSLKPTSQTVPFAADQATGAFTIGISADPTVTASPDKPAISPT